MKYFAFFLLAYFLLVSCQTSQDPYNLTESKSTSFTIASDDSTLVNIFNWATQTSDKHVGNETDPVGPWYEAALPNREAFCMRDVSHQCMGEEINGHGKENFNMMHKFMINISEEKDYCTYWEINRHNLPAPVDYASDHDFWYNLNANFDVLNACYRLYKWTGNEDYINHPEFKRFFELTVNEYMKTWRLTCDQIMDRPAVMHEDKSIKNPRFKNFRGLPSYVESVPGLTTTNDLIATIYRGLKSYAAIQEIYGNKTEAQKYDQKAEEFFQLFDTQWWNEETKNYYSFKLTDGLLKEGEFNVYTLWFEIVKDPTRLNHLLSFMVDKETNVESMSYYPMIFYRNAKKEIGYKYMKQLYKHERCEYPEVASSVIESIVCGLAGVTADATNNQVTTLPRLSDETHWVAIENIPLLSGKISVAHQSATKSSFVNKSSKEIVWKAMFEGKNLTINGSVTKQTTDILGNPYSYLEIKCAPGKCVSAEAKAI